MDVLTCIKKHSESDIRMTIKKITGETDDYMPFYVEALDSFKNLTAEKGYTLFIYIPEDENDPMDISLFNTVEIMKKYRHIRFFDSITDPLSLDRKQAEAVLSLAADLPKGFSLFELPKELIAGAELNKEMVYRYGELPIIANIIISMVADEGRVTEDEFDESMRQLSDMFQEEDVEDISFSTDLDLKSAEDSAEYEADRAENSRQMAARSIAYYKSMGKMLENDENRMLATKFMAYEHALKKEEQQNEMPKM